MSSEKVTQLIEKKREKSSLQDLWHNEDNTSYASEEKNIFENCFTTVHVSEIGNVDRYAIESATLQTDQKSVSPGMINLDETKQVMEDLNMYGREDAQNKCSDQIHLNTLYPVVDEIRNAEAVIKHSKMPSVQRNREPNICIHSERKTNSVNCFSNSETMYGSLGPNKRSETHPNEPQHGIAKVSGVLSSETGNPSLSNQISAQGRNKEHENVISDVRTDENKSRNKAMEAVESLMEVDEVDYYDSEDEYWNIDGVDNYAYDYVDNIQPPVYKTSSSGRYSEGLEQARNLPVFRRSIRKFALDNNFEVHDVIPDGNCMFWAIADQLMINGFPGHTEASLRQDAITYLRSKPLQKDGGHDSSFLSGETWEEYLTRMKRSREWGDHIVLQALVDVYCLQVIVFNVFQEDIRRTEVVVESNAHDEERLTIFLGHLGEFHYLSLRPKDWFEQWPYKALLCRMLVCSADRNHGDLESMIRDKKSNMERNKYISKDDLEKTSGFILQNVRRRHALHKESAENLYKSKCIFISASGEDLQLNDTEDSLTCLIEDPLLTDSMSGIPLLHLSVILRHLMPDHLIVNTGITPCTILTTSHYIGSVEDGSTFIRLKDVSQLQNMNDFYNKGEHQKHIVNLKAGLEAGLSEDVDLYISSSIIYIDASKTKPGYCRLLFPDDHVPDTDQITLKTESGLYLCGFDMPDIPNASNNEITTVGIRCAFDVVAKEWFFRKRDFDFPSPRLMLTVFGMYTTLISKPHHQSDNPAIEWKVNFSMIECVLMKHLSTQQFYGFKIFKVLLDNMTFHIERRLKTKHLKCVFFQTCEEIPTNSWTSNLGGCILFLLSKLLYFLKRFLPHYFIPERNLIEHFSANDIDTLCAVVESIRVFPTHVSQFVADKHGIAYGGNLVRSILVDANTFSKTRDVDNFINRVLPMTHQAAKFFTRIGFYQSTLSLLDSVHELSKFSCGQEIPKNFYEFLDIVLKHMKQRSTRIILAKMHDERFGTKMACSFLKTSERTLEKKLPWSSDFRINWVEVPENIADDLISIADFLYEQSLVEYHKRNATLATKFIETAIQCVKKAVQEDFIDVDNIEDMELKHEILEQKRELNAKLKQYLVHVFYVSVLYLKFYPLLNYVMDIEDMCKEFPEMIRFTSIMFRYLKQPDKSDEYAKKLKHGRFHSRVV